MSRRPNSYGGLSSAQQALLIRQLADRGVDPTTIPIEPQPPDRRHFPLSFGQERLWVEWELDRESLAYNKLFCAQLHGPLDRRSLAAALRTIEKRHVVLRSVVDASGDAPQQIVQPPSLVLGYTDLSGGDDVSSRFDMAMHQVAEMFRAPFRLDHAPPWRAMLLRLGHQEHILAVCLHHIASDGWSVGVFYRELSTLYSHYLADTEPALADLPVSYTDYAAWQRLWFCEELQASDLAYWQERLAKTRPAQLPNGARVVARRSSMGAKLRHTLPADLARDVSRLAAHSGVTEYMVFLAAFAVLLHRYSGETDLAIGTDVAGRDRQELEPLIGFFVNSIVLRCDLSGDPDVRALLARIRTTSVEAYTRQRVPFSMIVRRANPNRRLGSTPLGNVKFDFQNQPAAGLDLEGLQVTPLTLQETAVTTDLLCWAERNGDSFDVTLEYATELLSHAQAEDIHTRFREILQGFVSTPQERVSRLPLGAIVSSQSAPAPGGDGPDDSALWSRFQKHLSETDARTALRWRGTEISYGRLFSAARAVAERLQRAGLPPQSPVVHCAPRSPEAIACMLGTMISGNVYVPLDPEWTPTRCREIAETVGARAAVGPAHLTERFDCAVKIEPSMAETGAYSGAGIAGPCAEYLAYILHTSGSTGRPKGVMIDHRTLSRHCMAAMAAYGLRPEDRVLQFAPLTFDPSLEQILPSLAAGACVVLPSDEDMAPDALHRLILRESVTVMNLPTGYWHELVDAWVQGRLFKATGAVRLVLPGGARMSPATLHLWHQHCPEHIRLMNAYGPTETTVTATLWHGPRDSTLPAGQVPIGQASFGKHVAVLDAAGAPVRPGEEGELYIGGDGVALGYFGMPAATAERFAPDPFAAEPGARLYRTGDRVRLMDSGDLEYLGRTDRQIKLRDRRLEPGEVERIMLEQPGILEAAVTLTDDDVGLQRLVAAVVPEDTAHFDGQTVRQAIANRLPRWMVPTEIMALRHLPLDGNGKLDYKAVATALMDGAVPPAAGSHKDRSQKDSLEEKLCGLLADLLGKPAVDAGQNFFDLGGDSILAIRFAARARQAGLSLSVRDVFVHQTPSELARALAPRRAPQPAKRADRVSSAPVTPIQARFLDRHRDDLSGYGNIVHVDFTHGVSETRLREAVRRLRRHHSALRTRFYIGDQGWRQELDPTDDGAAGFQCDTSHDRTDTLARAAQVLEQIDPTVGPPMRFVFFRLADGRGDRLSICAHHLVVDNISWRILLDDLDSMLTSDPMPELPAADSFLDWAAATSTANTAGAAPSEPGGVDQAANGPLPQAEHRKVRSECVATRHGLSVTQSDQLRAYCAARPGVEIDGCILAACATAITTLTGSDAIDLLIEEHGRDTTSNGLDTSRIVGWFTTLATATMAPAPAGNLDALAQHATNILRAKQGAFPDPSCEPSIAFNFLGDLDADLRRFEAFGVASDSFGLHERRRVPGDQSLDINTFVLDCRLHLEILYVVDWIDAAFVERLVTAALGHLEALAAKAPSPVAPFPLTAMQHGMLFETLMNPNSGAYVVQTHFDMDDRFEPAEIEAAWSATIDYYPALRTSFSLDAENGAVQRVHDHVPFELSRVDHRGMDAAACKNAFEEVLDRDRRRGFDPTSPPLIRVTLIREPVGRVRVLWTYHHLLLDGWSSGIVLQRVLSRLGGRAHDPSTAPPAFKTFIDWLARQPRAESERFWRHRLAQVGAAPALPGREQIGPSKFIERARTLPRALSDDLRRFASRNGLTVNSIMLGAWVQVVGELSATHTPVVGVTVSGRPPELDRVGDIVGPFMNTIPLVSKRTPGQDQVTWLHDLQVELLLIQDEQSHRSLAELQRWSAAPAGSSLFSSLFVFENYPLEAQVWRDTSALGVRETGFRTWNVYPLTVKVFPQADLAVSFLYDTGLFEDGSVDHWTRMYLHRLERLISGSAPSGPTQAKRRHVAVDGAKIGPAISNRSSKSSV